MTTTFFRFKKLVKRFIKGILPNFLYKGILTPYRLFFSYIPNYLHKNHINNVFKNRQIITIKNSQIKIIVDPKNGGTDAELFLNKERDTDVIDIMRSQLNHGSVFLDIGANIGYETLWGASLVGNTGHVYSFEPLPNLVNQIKESLSLNNFSNLSIIPKAASNTEGTANIHIHDEDAGLTSLTNTKNSSKTVTVTLTTINKELENIQRLDVIKLDVEGHEYEALLGGKETIEKYKPTIIFEFSPHLYEKDYRGKSVNILYFLDSLGYSIYSIENLYKKIHIENFNGLIEKILVDETIPNFVATIFPIII